MLLSKVTIYKYKSFITEQSLNVEPSVTRIVGKNESGKTALLEAMGKTNYFETDNKEFKFDKTLDYPRGTMTKVLVQTPNAVTCEYIISDYKFEEIESTLGKGVLTSKVFSKTLKYDNSATISGVNTNYNQFIAFIINSYALVYLNILNYIIKHLIKILP